MIPFCQIEPVVIPLAAQFQPDITNLLVPSLPCPSGFTAASWRWAVLPWEEELPLSSGSWLGDLW